MASRKTVRAATEACSANIVNLEAASMRGPRRQLFQPFNVELRSV
jgi:hypothetical protein